MAEVARDVEAGIMGPECAGAAEMYPESLLGATDSALEAFEAEVRVLVEPSDEELFGTVERAVLALNAVHSDAGFGTVEREQLREYIDLTLVEHGVDVTALAARRGIDRAAITDARRDG
ncbi:hypothetical protein AW27_023765 [Streptomyces sp. PCS3-D2]|uniref:hypothetical protein n=1 Tax=Streptomyces sp. PCS3-D2 TaxID=1460244 RepID=UPI000450B436|nr:hypothetical protein [Streptomyces sp. PCS3-D2]WKV74261.1 hypothetical protein AW27_023765 [Streptomyces sp. PCS3-D2]